MVLAWLILFLGSWIRLLTISGLDFHRGATILALAPLGFVALHHFLPGVLRAPERSSFRWALAVLTALLSLAFIRLTLLRFWDPTEWLPTILLVLIGLGIAMFVSQESPNDRGPGPWLWVFLWMLISGRDPVLGLLGAGLAPLVFHWGNVPKTAKYQQTRTPSLNWMLPFLLGLFLPKPWWDWGLQSASVLPLAAFGLAGGIASVASLAPFANRLRPLPGWLLIGALAVTGLLYSPSWGLIWGALMGILAACAYGRLQKPLAIGAVAGYWILGMLLSFTLQANAWLPVLGRLAWLVH